MLHNLLAYARINKINLQLSVDSNNIIAKKLYLSCGFYNVKDNETYTIMMTKTKFEMILQVSSGEAYDKLSILDIKIDKIKDDDKKAEIIKEKMAIEPFLDLKSNKLINFYYTILKDVNNTIWDLQDEFRCETDNNSKQKICEQIIYENDRRFKIKNKLNIISKSDIKEQKGYSKTSVLFLGHLGLGDCILLSQISRFLSTIYDKVYVVCRKKYIENINFLYKDDPGIHLFEINNDYDISPNIGCPMHVFENIAKKYDKVIMVGYHKLPSSVCDLIPFCFYDDAGVDRKIYKQFCFIPESSISDNFLLKIREVSQEHILIHTNTSYGKLFDFMTIENEFNINKNEILCINICENVYEKGHKFYDICEELVNRPIFDYSTILKTSKKLFLSDSCILCLAIMLKCQGKIFNFNRDNTNYSYLIDFQ
jgi:hypothetical protein